jgi:hypothetical protein
MLDFFFQQMAPTRSKPILEPRPPGIRKRVLAASLASTDNVDLAAVKRRKLEEAIAAQRQQRQPSVEDIDDDDEDLTSNTNLRPQNASHILEAADGSDDVQLDVGMGGVNSDDEGLPGLEAVDTSDQEDGEDEEGDSEVGETDEEELSKSPVNYHQKLRLTVTFLSSVSDRGLDLTNLCLLSVHPRYHLQC